MASHPVDVHVGKRLRLRRSMLGLSQEQLGKEIGVTFQQIQKYERGVNRVGSSRLYDFAKVMGVAVGYFFDDMDGETAAAAGFAEDSAGFEKQQLDNKETLALIRAYYRITDPDVRKKVLSLVKAMGPVEDDKPASNDSEKKTG